MQASLSQWKKRKLQEVSEMPKQVTLRCGQTISMADWKPDRVQAVMADLTFSPRVGFDTGAPPPLICCYSAEDGQLTLPRCYRGLPGAAVCDELTAGRPMEVPCRAQLNEIQALAHAASCTALKSPPFACILTLPCGYGKTVVALAIAASLKRRTLVVVHKENLLEQWAERIKQFLPSARVGVIQQSRAEWEDVDISIAMLQTVCAKQMPAGCLEAFGLVVLDEAHHMAAAYFSRLFFKLPSRHILGLTATPRRKDGCTEILHLFMGGFSYQLATRMDADVKVVLSEWHNKFSCTHDATPPEVQRFKTRLTLDAERNAHLLAVVREAVRCGRCVILLSDRVEHLTGLKASFATEGAPPCALFVGGRSKKNLEERRRAETEARVIFATFAMASEGLDIPRLDTLLLATPIADVTQAVGRILRPCADKKAPVIVDLLDDGCRAFGRLAAARRGVYERSAFQIKCYEADTFA